MTLIVALFGLLFAGVGLYGMVQPRRLVAWVESAWSKDLLWVAVGIRFALGTFLVYAAPECRASQMVWALGVITILAAVGLALIGGERMTAIVQWWTERPPAAIRAWSALVVPLGAFLVYAGV